mgnify:CR=1 FL=1
MRVLLVEDDATNAGFITKGLRESGHVVEAVSDGRDGLSAAQSGDFDVIVLDRMLPGLDGLMILKQLRQDNNPCAILILSALGQLDHRVEGLRLGADDYLAKPFAMSELLARLDAVARRKGPQRDSETMLVCQDVVLDLPGRRVKRAGSEIDLHAREFLILEYLMRNAGRVVTRGLLLENVWDYRFDPQTNVIDVHISRLRRKLNDRDVSPLIETIRGIGYRCNR